MNILSIGAHCDDIELGCGATLAKLVLKGHNVFSLVLTDSGYCAPDGHEIRSSAHAQNEAQHAADIIGARLTCWDYKTFYLQNDESLTARLHNFIQSKSIDTVFTHWAHDVHRDHAVAAHATLMAARHIPRVLMYRSNWYTGTRPFHGTHFYDVSQTFSIKIHALSCYTSELSRVGNTWRDYVTRQAQIDGCIVGVDYAECFEVIRYTMEL